MKRMFWTSVALAFAALGTAACGPTQEQAAADPEGPEGIAVQNGRLMLPPVAGNPGAVYFDVINSGDSDTMIRAASVQGAQSAELHQMGTWNLQPSMEEVFQIGVPAGETLSFEPGGLHVMANELADTVVPGSSVEVTLTFVGGDKISFPAEVRAAGEDR